MSNSEIVALSRRLTCKRSDNIGSILDAIKEEVKYLKEVNPELYAYHLNDVGIISKNGYLHAKLYFSKSYGNSRSVMIN